MDALLISVISACTALVASIAGALVTLTINPLEPDHQRLYEAIDAALKRLKFNDAADAETEADIETITALAQVILKREWLRVKADT